MDWKAKPLHQLVELLIKLIKTQFKDIERALIENGPLRLNKEYEQFKIDANDYVKKSEKERKKYWAKFMASDGSDPSKSSQLSTDGRFVVPRTPSGGKKRNQTKSSRGERTLSRKRKMKKAKK